MTACNCDLNEGCCRGHDTMTAVDAARAKLAEIRERVEECAGDDATSLSDFFVEALTTSRSLVVAIEAVLAIPERDTSEIFTHSSYYAQGYNAAIEQFRSAILEALGVEE